MKKKTINNGFTLVEMLIGICVLILVVLSLWGAYQNSIKYFIKAREIRIATDDLQDVMEKLHSVDFSGITGLFPDGSAVPGDLIGGLSLQGETIVVRYPGGSGTDPLVIEVEITWTGYYGESNNKVFRTVRTSSV